MPRYHLIQLATTPQHQLTTAERDSLDKMKKEIYDYTIREVQDSLRCFENVKDAENFILALQHRDIPGVRQAIQKVPRFQAICETQDYWMQNQSCGESKTKWDARDTRVQAHAPALDMSYSTLKSVIFCPTFYGLVAMVIF